MSEKLLVGSSVTLEKGQKVSLSDFCDGTSLEYLGEGQAKFHNTCCICHKGTFNIDAPPKQCGLIPDNITLNEKDGKLVVQG